MFHYAINLFAMHFLTLLFLFDGNGALSVQKKRHQVHLIIPEMCNKYTYKNEDTPNNPDANKIVTDEPTWVNTSHLNMNYDEDMKKIADRSESYINENTDIGLPQVSITSSSFKELCEDKSFGVFQLLSSSMLLRDEGAQNEDAEGEHIIVTSLPSSFCQLVANQYVKKNKQFVSWTCSQMAGILSLKPEEFVEAFYVAETMRKYEMSKAGLVKLSEDESPYCESLATSVEKQDYSNNNKLFYLGDVGNLKRNEYSNVMKSLHGLFICISYERGISTKSGLNRLIKLIRDSDVSAPIIVMPEWPLSLELIMLKLYQPEDKAESEHFDNLHFLSLQYDLHLQHQFLQRAQSDETLLTKMIMLSIATWADADHAKRSMKPQSFSTNEQTKSHSSFHLETNRIPGDLSSNHQLGFQHCFIYKLDKERWELDFKVELKTMGNLKEGSGTKAISMKNSFIGLKAAQDKDVNEEKVPESIFFQVVFAAIFAGTVLSAFFLAFGYYSKKEIDSTENLSDAQYYRRRMYRPSRAQAPYKVLLTSQDINFGHSTTICHSDHSANKIKEESEFEVATESTTEYNQAEEYGEEEMPPEKAEDQNRMNGAGDEKPDLIKGSFSHSSSTCRRMSVANMKNDSITLSENQARYKGEIVHLRKLGDPTDSFKITSKALTVLETIHGLRHENLVAMIGFLSEGTPAIVWEYCSRGSLHDVLLRCELKLDWVFKLSLLTDLVRGMRYLHSSLARVHGFLTSLNCVIDARWVLKITDYGILSFLNNQGMPHKSRNCKELFWTAPELLREEGLRKHGTQPGDVYSFGIIMQEILVRGEPFCMVNFTPEELIERLKAPPPLIRPSVSKGVGPPEAINIMRQCWAELPDMRPDFNAIHDHFKTLNHGRKANIVDSMFQMLEKYSNNLEELIKERTAQLDLEKKKTEHLLNRMLPSTVAEKLKLGLPVDPEEFDEVTIYFSDIVGFTTISAYSTPFEVVDLLNDLYTCFDATIDDYNVYKVETIGDAYMVVGGVPLWSEDHADHIATMALDLLHQSGKFRIRHLPQTPLKVRIGIHTGPCCAGVVGLTMPRYCLFGDTVNTASRMESTGAPWRIHISNSTKCKLDAVGGYKIESRGLTHIKGKGDMNTYWLLGKEGFNKKLPKAPDLNEKHGMTKESIMKERANVAKMQQEKDGTNAVSDTIISRQSPKKSVSSPIQLTPPNPCDLKRSLSPAEEVAHQLLNGRPAARGLRRQFSIDQTANSNRYLNTPESNKCLSLDERSTLKEPFSKMTLRTASVDSHHPEQGDNIQSSQREAEGISSIEQGKDKQIFFPSLSPRTEKKILKNSKLSIVEESPTSEH